MPEAFAYKSLPLTLRLRHKFEEWFVEYVPLGEAICVAVSLHVLFFPLMWFGGWALPWPKGPSYTTVIYINLENWPEDASPKRIEELYTKALRGARPRGK